MNLWGRTPVTQTPRFTGRALAAVRPVGLDRCVTTCVASQCRTDPCHCRHTVVCLLVLPSFYPGLPLGLLLPLAFSVSCVPLRFFPVFSWFDSSFLFSAE